MKINAYDAGDIMRVHDDGRGQHFPVLVSKVATVTQLMASSTLIFFYLMLFVQVSADMP